MEIRKDLQEVEALIHRLLAIGETFSINIDSWIHLKNREDFSSICRIPFEYRYLVEAVYADGRDMAQFMAWTIADINGDYSAFPTLTSIIDVFNDTYVYGNYDSSVPDTAKATCEKHNVNLWSVNQMIALYRRQENSLSAIRVTLKMLKDSDLYKKENGIEVMKESQATINVSGVSGSAININSTGACATVSTNYNEPEIFTEILDSIRQQQLNETVTQELVDNVKMLASSHENGTFAGAYKDFIQNVSAHITVFSPFIAGLTALL